MPDSTVIIFSKIPFEGHTMTRLMPQLTGRECVLLHCAILTDLLGQLQKLCQERPDVVVALYHASHDRACFLQEYHDGLSRLSNLLDADSARIGALRAFMDKTVSFYPQTGNDLGERMFNAEFAVLQRSAKAVIVGTDCPQLGASDFSTAFDALDRHDMVIGGSTDGGYYLIGLKEADRAVFENITWSSGNVYRDSLLNAQKRGLSVGELPIYTDIDYIEDIMKLLAEDAKRLKVTAPLTLQYLRYGMTP